MNTANRTPETLMSEDILPAEVSIQSDTWLNRYRNFPVFSRTWYKHRLIAFGGTTTVLFLIFTLVSILTKDKIASYMKWTLPFFIFAICLFSIGQAIAVWVRQKQYAPRKEAILISLALVFGAVSSAAIGALAYTAAKSIFGAGGTTTTISITRTPNKPALAASLPAESADAATDKTKDPETDQETADTEDKKKADERIKKFGPVGNLVIMLLAYFPIIITAIYWGSFFDLLVFFRQRRRLAEALQRHELERAQNARREAELRLSVLVAQVEPHFLFNTLAGVRSAILTEPLRATAIVDHLVDYLRSTIPQMRNDGSTEQGRLAKQLEAARAYLSLMQARIPRLSFSVESELKDAAFPPLMLISLVENAIKHGVEPKIGVAHISVNARYFDEGDEEKLEVTVTDDGVGFGGTSSGSGIGLANIRERLESMYGKRASLTLKARPEGGVIASIVMPLSSVS